MLAKYLKGKGGNLYVTINKGIIRAADEPETKLAKFLSQLAAESIPLDGINIATILSLLPAARVVFHAVHPY